MGAKTQKQRKCCYHNLNAKQLNDVNDYIKTLAGDRVIVFDSSQVLANSQGIVDPKYSRDLLHINSAGYAALNNAIAGILVP